MKIALPFFATLLLAPLAFAQPQGWKYSGEMTILTTPEGANLPTGASVENFPLLVRLHRDWFDFAQAQPNGADVRFTDAKGAPLPYEIEFWDANTGEAAIWVKIPRIEGNARQSLKIHWGKADAQNESNPKAVFNQSNGYASVWHMGRELGDATGLLTGKDTGTTPTTGLIGESRSFLPGKGINGGENITGLPAENEPHSTEAWIRASRANGNVIGWGIESGQSKVVMSFASPPHIRVDAYFSPGNVESKSRLKTDEWLHVIHTYKDGEARVYVNGALDGSATSRGGKMAIKSPARLYIGGWYNNYNFTGDVDEVRVSKVARSPDWIKLQYENQKPLQTLVGPIIQNGAAWSVSAKELTVPEGQSATITAQAGGAQKLYWILKKGGAETVVATDRLRYTFDAGRVVADQNATLQLKAVFADGAKTQDVAIAIKEAIPEPIFTLKAPAKWDGRAPIEIAPQIKNLAAMTAKNAGDLKVEWQVGPFAAIKEISPAKLRLLRALNGGALTVTASISNGGAPVSQSATIAVTPPKSEPWIERTPAPDEKPEDGQFYARDDKNEGTLFYNGTLEAPADAVFLRVFADDKPYKTERQKPDKNGRYAFSAKLKPGLIQYKIEFGTVSGGAETVRHTVSNLVCGDAYLIDGQSNALATDTREQAPPETSEWIRSYGRPSGNEKTNLWCNPVWKARNGEKAELGWWGMELAKRLVESQKVPIFIINAAVGGTRIDQHQRNDANPTDLSTIYGRMLWRVQGAKLTHGIRGILWHQGENDQGADGPAGGYGWESYQKYFLEMSAAWKQDFPNVRKFYVFQIWPNSCAMGGRDGNGDRLREKQRTLPFLYSDMSIMSTLGVRPPGGCHFPLTGWAEFARLIQPVIERDFYGATPAAPVTAPNLRRAAYNAARDSVILEFDQPVAWEEKLASQFYLDGEAGQIEAGSVAGNALTLKLKVPSAAKTITYLKEANWNQDTLLLGTNGIAALTFCEVPIG
jgi:hypothetical protein